MRNDVDCFEVAFLLLRNDVRNDVRFDVRNDVDSLEPSGMMRCLFVFFIVCFLHCLFSLFVFIVCFHCLFSLFVLLICCPSFVFVVGCCWVLFDVVGCCLLLLGVVGCCLVLLVFMQRRVKSDTAVTSNVVIVHAIQSDQGK